MIFFGVGSGRCGTMTLVNLLSNEDCVVALHEGKVRNLEESGEQWLPFLTLQNLKAYFYPEDALSIFQQNREQIPEIMKEKKINTFGDVAYNYAPFVKVIPKIFHDAKLIIIVRDGRDFVRSAYTDENPDLTPVGWPDERSLSRLERYISLGRLRMKDSEDSNSEWLEMSPFEKNCWLWNETNKVIFNGLKSWREENVMIVRFEDFFKDIHKNYEKVRLFLGLKGFLPEVNAKLMSSKINKRKHFKIPKWEQWTEDMTASFDKYAGEMMRILKYY